MKAIDYIFPIFEDAGGKEGIDLIGNGFFVGNLFITADHVVSDSYFTPFIIIMVHNTILKRSLEYSSTTIVYHMMLMVIHSGMRIIARPTLLFTDLIILK